MEELDIKQIWKQGGNQERFSYSEEAIDAIIKQQPQNIVSKFVKTLRIERWANLIVLSLIGVYLSYVQYWVAAGVLLLINFGFFYYYHILIQKLDRKFIDNNVVQYLNEVHQSICRFITHFKITLVVIGIASFLLGFYLGYIQHDDFEAMLDTVSMWKWIWAGVVIAGSLVFAYYMFYYMYGKKAQQIKKMVESLNNEETEI
ncbi:hypothetical protein KO507_08980 [Gilvimarinus agarilyticus]|uniref:DUF3278 domain-containing protein n=1 Tax=Reichenbachiella agariperforans TaxID=156994 RepID=A0A1M6VYF6_REIAG|nr:MULTISPECIES: hypothetical protein [Reichenbachiella]MBU2885892.1 hypothetical protein [Gilvimarinus agarilyticus]MBU2915275.1 hypothetical protein [Reichenbachiella agariperforans]RJE70934.1 hypothetical protein BGP76_09150 [Reichenbachiella sp. MSK19-1]SHK86366.1 hypothetical protein SAMN04488028_11045 [Reichenbachiella agariperforans]